MKKLGLIAASLSFLAVSGGYAAAQPRNDPRQPMGMHQDQRPDPHSDWRKGGRIGHDDWNRGAQVDYRSHHLRQPPRGYEWRQVDGRYILAAVATGVIADIILNAR